MPIQVCRNLIPTGRQLRKQPLLICIRLGSGVNGVRQGHEPESRNFEIFVPFVAIFSIREYPCPSVDKMQDGWVEELG